MVRREYEEIRVETRRRLSDGTWGRWSASEGSRHLGAALPQVQGYVERMNEAREGVAEFRVMRRWVIEDVTDWEVVE